MKLKRGVNKSFYWFSIIIFISFILLIFLYYGLLKKTITGYASSQPTNLTITVSGTSPAIITYVSQISATNPVEATNRSIVFSATGYDANGVADLNDSSFTAYFNKSGETTRTGTCTLVADIDSTSANYSCTINMWYWDGSSTWDVNVSGTDLGNKSLASNSSKNFTLNQLKAMVISPNTLTWSAITPSATNQTSDNDPTRINNTGNYNGTIDATAINLLGQTDSSFVINASNFTIGLSTGAGDPECDGIRLANNTLTTITNSISNRGNLSLGSGSGQEDFYYCIPKVPSSLSSQTYSTTTGGSWTIGY